MTDIQTISIVLAGIGVFIAAVNSIISSRRAEKNDQQMLETRQAQLFMQIYNRWNTKAMAEQYGRIRYSYDINSYEDWAKLTGYETGKVTDFNVYSDVQSMANFFEGIGVLVQRGLINIELVEDLLANRVIWFWELWRPISETAQPIIGDTKMHDQLKYLYNLVKQRAQQTTAGNT
jgi:hypothetical protein